MVLCMKSEVIPAWPHIFFHFNRRPYCHVGWSSADAGDLPRRHHSQPHFFIHLWLDYISLSWDGQGGRILARVAAFIGVGGDLGEVGSFILSRKIKVNPSFWSSTIATRNLTLEYLVSKSIYSITVRPQRPKWPLTSLFVHGANTSVYSRLGN